MKCLPKKCYYFFEKKYFIRELSGGCHGFGSFLRFLFRFTISFIHSEMGRLAISYYPNNVQYHHHFDCHHHHHYYDDDQEEKSIIFINFFLPMMMMIMCEQENRIEMKEFLFPDYIELSLLLSNIVKYKSQLEIELTKKISNNCFIQFLPFII